ncbi:MAG TPA: hypothetical protein DD640_03510 [Clostridiales bacterium]|nr:hypothetical protein [Clostridiales bacterium]
MPIEATTRIDYEAYREYYLFNFLQGKRSVWQARILFIFTPLLALIFLVLFLLNPQDLVNLAGMAIMLVMGLLLALIILVIPKRYYRSVEQALMVPNHYVFADDQMTVQPESDPLDEPVVFRYETILKVHETAYYFFLSLSKGQSCIVGKNDFTSGTPAELRELLTERLGERFIITKSAEKAAQA